MGIRTQTMEVGKNNVEAETSALLHPTDVSGNKPLIKPIYSLQYKQPTCPRQKWALFRICQNQDNSTAPTASVLPAGHGFYRAGRCGARSLFQYFLLFAGNFEKRQHNCGQMAFCVMKKGKSPWVVCCNFLWVPTLCVDSRFGKRDAWE